MVGTKAVPGGPRPQSEARFVSRGHPRIVARMTLPIGDSDGQHRARFPSRTHLQIVEGRLGLGDRKPSTRGPLSLQRLSSFRRLVSVFALPPVGVKVTLAVTFTLPVILSL